MGSFDSIKNRSSHCCFCRSLVHIFGSNAPQEANCFLTTVSPCLCSKQWSQEREGFCICHPRHIQISLEGRCRKYAFFQVLSDSPTSLAEVLKAGLRILESTEENCFTGRIVPDRANPEPFLQWLQLCQRHHGPECDTPIWPGAPIQPQNLLAIDVLHRCILTAPANCRFMALSYVWGSQQSTILTHSNHKNLSTPGALDSSVVSATIWDAMQVTYAMSERYLWVDSLCILQDDPSFQQDQISQMGAIYSKAVVTIVAADGHAGTGLSGVRAGTRALQQELVALPDLILLRAAEFYTTPARTPPSEWQKRAWTYQEALFSRRLLIFRKGGIIWHCQSANWTEYKNSEVKEASLKLMCLQDLDIGESALVRKLPQEIEGLGSRITDGRSYQQYMGLVHNYYRRHLSFESDILNAFAGIAQALSELYRDEFIWGLPRARFTYALLWNAKLSSSRLTDAGGRQFSQTYILPDGKKHELPCPSWSWASSHGTSNGDLQLCHLESPLQTYLIVIYSVLTNGEVKRLTPSDDSMDEQVLENQPSHRLTREWVGTPRIIGGISHTTLKADRIHSGELEFWTSVACIFSIEERQALSRPTRRVWVSSEGDLLLVSGEAGITVSFNDSQIPQKLRSSRFKTKQGQDLEGDLQIGICHLIIIEGQVLNIRGGLSGLSGTGRMLLALRVMWKDGSIALRNGDPVTIAEEDWVSLQTRVWKLVTLR